VEGLVLLLFALLQKGKQLLQQAELQSFISSACMWMVQFSALRCCQKYDGCIRICLNRKRSRWQDLQLGHGVLGAGGSPISQLYYDMHGWGRIRGGGGCIALNDNAQKSETLCAEWKIPCVGKDDEISCVVIPM